MENDTAKDEPRVQPNPDGSYRWRESGRRIAVTAVVIGGHFGLLMLLLYSRPAPWHEWPGRVASPRNIIRLRFIETAPPQPAPRSKPLAPVARRAAPARRPRKPAIITAATVPADVPSPAPRQPVAPSTTVPGYIAGGNLLHGSDLDRSSSIRLPGSGVAIVAGIHMVDPRTQGLAGAARTLQAMFGVPDTHCVKVDAWRTLSTREMLARHISPEQVQKTAEAYGCLPKT